MQLSDCNAQLNDLDDETQPIASDGSKSVNGRHPRVDDLDEGWRNTGGVGHCTVGSREGDVEVCIAGKRQSKGVHFELALGL